MNEIYLIQVIEKSTGKHLGYIHKRGVDGIDMGIKEFGRRDSAERNLQILSNEGKLSSDYYYCVIQTFKK